MKYLVLDFRNDLHIMKISSDSKPAYVFAGKCKAYFLITESRGRNIVSLIEAFIYGAKHEAVLYFLRLWNINIEDCFALSSLLGLFIDTQDAMWLVSKVNAKHLNGGKGIIGVHSNPFFAICSYYVQMHAAGIKYSLTLKNT